MGSSTISIDEFQALEQKVLQAVELIRKERDARAAAESDLATARNEISNLEVRVLTAEDDLEKVRAELTASQAEAAELRDKVATTAVVQSEVESLHREREAVRQRVEKMLAQMDELL